MRAALVALMMLAGIAHAERDYARYEPKGLKKPAPLIVVLHCYGCPPRYLVEGLALEKLADEKGVLLAIPSGHTDSQGNPYWNATEACCDFARSGVDDVGYVTHVIDEMVKSHGADPKRVYLVGWSNGGFLAHRLACEHPDKIAAFVSMGGGAPASCNAHEAVGALEIHGTADDIVPLSGGKLGGKLPKVGTFPDLRTTMTAWAGRDHCKLGPGCAAELWTTPGGHDPAFGPELTARIWSFLSAQRKK